MITKITHTVGGGTIGWSGRVKPAYDLPAVRITGTVKSITPLTTDHPDRHARWQITLTDGTIIRALPGMILRGSCSYPLTTGSPVDQIRTVWELLDERTVVVDCVQPSDPTPAQLAAEQARLRHVLGS